VLEQYSIIAANDKTAPGFAAETVTGSEISVQVLDTPDLGDVEVYVTDRLDTDHLLVVSREEPDSFAGGIAKYEFNGVVIHMNDTLVFTEVLDEDEADLQAERDERYPRSLLQAMSRNLPED